MLVARGFGEGGGPIARHLAEAEKENVEVEKLLKTALPPADKTDHDFLASGLSSKKAKQLSRQRLDNSISAYQGDHRWGRPLGLMDHRSGLQEQYIDMDHTVEEMRHLAEQALWAIDDPLPKFRGGDDPCVHQVCHLLHGGLCCKDPDLKSIEYGIKSLEAHVQKLAGAKASTLIRFSVADCEALAFLGKIVKKPHMTRAMLLVERCGLGLAKLELKDGLPELMTTHCIFKGLIPSATRPLRTIRANVMSYIERRDLSNETLVVELGDCSTAWEVSLTKPPAKKRKSKVDLPFGLKMPKQTARAKAMPAWFNTSRWGKVHGRSVRARYNKGEIRPNTASPPASSSQSEELSDSESSGESSSSSSSSDDSLPPEVKEEVKQICQSKEGFRDFSVAKTARSVCYHCGREILAQSLRWKFIYHHRKYHRWVHLRCAPAMIVIAAADLGKLWLAQCIAELERGCTDLESVQQREVDDLLRELRSRHTEG